MKAYTVAKKKAQLLFRTHDGIIHPVETVETDSILLVRTDTKAEAERVREQFPEELVDQLLVVAAPDTVTIEPKPDDEPELDKTVDQIETASAPAPLPNESDLPDLPQRASAGRVPGSRPPTTASDRLTRQPSVR